MNGKWKKQEDKVNHLKLHQWNDEEELQQALRQEREYQKCPHRRTTCKALEDLIYKYNKPTTYCSPYSSSSMVEKSSVQKFRFNQYGSVVQTYEMLVDPGRFWSHDLLRSENYGERPFL